MTTRSKRPATRKGGVLTGIALAAFVVVTGAAVVVLGLVYWLP